MNVIKRAPIETAVNAMERAQHDVCERRRRSAIFVCAPSNAVCERQQCLNRVSLLLFALLLLRSAIIIIPLEYMTVTPQTASHETTKLPIGSEYCIHWSN